MKKFISQNDGLDLLVAELLRATALNDVDIDLIASKEDLFSSVRAQIIADNATRIESSRSITFFQRSAILTAAAAVIVVAVFGTMMTAKRPGVRQVVTVPAKPLPHQKDEVIVSRADTPVQDPIGEAETPQFSDRSFRTADYRPAAVERRTSVEPQPRLEEQPPRFFTLAGIRPSEVAVDGSRIIRVELPRASLVSLGVNLPLDSDKQLIKTDLLVGPDGVPRAIRLVE